MLTIIIFCLFTCNLSGCAGQNNSPYTKTAYLFDTVITISVYEESQTAVLELAMTACQEFENLFSPTIEGSDVWNINHSDGNWVSVSAETISILEEALDYCELSEGKLDITVSPVKALWNFTSENSGKENSHPIPSAADLDTQLAHVDYRLVQIDGNQVRLTDPLAAIDFGFIAKGYIADRIGELLKENGVQHALINLGGNVLAVGTKPDGTPFKVGIQYPFEDMNTPITATESAGSSVVTSGIYERYFTRDGVIYHHILDTETGLPVRNNLLSVTIISDSSTKCDALSTYCLILGLEDGMALIDSMEGVEAIFITDDYRVHYSE